MSQWTSSPPQEDAIERVTVRKAGRLSVQAISVVIMDAVTQSTPSAEPRLCTAEFVMDIVPGTGDLDGTGRFNFTKMWTGGMTGESRGFMFSAGDPASGNAGYVALETFDGSLDGRRGTLALQQFGTMNEGVSVLHYEIVPGSGTERLLEVTGTIELTVTENLQKVAVRYSLP